MSFEPVYNEHSRALILGTWPSPKSREMAFYYGHPQNRFWPMLAALTGEQTPAREDIEAKKQIILRHGLALWDTLERCTITGASDASIRDAVPNIRLPKFSRQAGRQRSRSMRRCWIQFLADITTKRMRMSGLTAAQ